MVKFHSADDALRAALIRRFAEANDEGRPRRCACAEKKIVFGDERAVNGFITTAHDLDGQFRRAYPCPRIHGVWHFTSTEPPEATCAP